MSSEQMLWTEGSEQLKESMLLKVNGGNGLSTNSLNHEVQIYVRARPTPPNVQRRSTFMPLMEKLRRETPESNETLSSQAQPVHTESVCTPVSLHHAKLVESLLARRRPSADIPLLGTRNISKPFARAVRASPLSAYRSADAEAGRRRRGLLSSV